VEPLGDCIGFVESAGDFFFWDMVLYVGSFVSVLGSDIMCSAYALNDHVCQPGIC
jgi:hypothetical protein